MSARLTRLANSSRRIQTAPRTKQDNVFPCAYIACILFLIGCFFCGFAIVSYDSYPWISTTVTVPVHSCRNGTRSLDEPDLFLTCTKFTTSNQTFNLLLNPYRAARITANDNTVISVVSWSDLTDENTCTPGTPMFKLYGKANSMCTSGSAPILNFPVNYFPTFTAGIICLSFLLAFLVMSCCAGLFKKPHVALTMLILIALTCVVSCAYGLGYWLSFPLVPNYFNNRFTSYAPMRPVNVTMMGYTFTGARGFQTPVYKLAPILTNSTFIPVPIYKPFVYNGNGLTNFVALMIVTSLGFLFVCCDTLTFNAKPTEQPASGTAPPSTTFSSPEATAEPIPVAFVYTTNVPGASSFSPDDYTKDYSDVPRPNRPAPPQAGGDITMV